jgi:adenylate kinase family enzyme
MPLSSDPDAMVWARAFEGERIVVIGCAGSGKSTLAGLLSERLTAPHIRRDWLGPEGSDQYRDAAAAAVSGCRWVFDGAPYYVEDLVYGRADLVVGFDLPRREVMRRVITRSVRESLGRLSVPAHHDRRWRAWLDPQHPVRWAWSTWSDRRHELADIRDHGMARQATMVAFSTPAGVTAWLAGRYDRGWSAWPPMDARK